MPRKTCTMLHVLLAAIICSSLSTVQAVDVNAADTLMGTIDTRAGVHTSISAQTFIDGGWTSVLDEPYSHRTSASDVDLTGTYADDRCVLVGAKTSALSSTFAVAAFNTVGKVAGTTSGNAVRSEAGAYWYHTPGRAFGFADTSTVSLNTADIHDPASLNRLSWHMQGMVGGYRAGNVHGGSVGNYRKVIMVAPASFANCASCPAGYSHTGDLDAPTCTDVDECADGSANCVDGAVCTNTPGGFSCDCPPGYTLGNTACQPDLPTVEFCNAGDRAGCFDHGVCTTSEATGKNKCVCDPNFTGTRCGSELQPGACDPATLSDNDALRYLSGTEVTTAAAPGEKFTFTVKSDCGVGCAKAVLMVKHADGSGHYESAGVPDLAVSADGADTVVAFADMKNPDAAPWLDVAVRVRCGDNVSERYFRHRLILSGTGQVVLESDGPNPPPVTPTDPNLSVTVCRLGAQGDVNEALCGEKAVDDSEDVQIRIHRPPPTLTAATVTGCSLVPKLEGGNGKVTAATVLNTNDAERSARVRVHFCGSPDGRCTFTCTVSGIEYVDPTDASNGRRILRGGANGRRLSTTVSEFTVPIDLQFPLKEDDGSMGVSGVEQTQRDDSQPATGDSDADTGAAPGTAPAAGGAGNTPWLSVGVAAVGGALVASLVVGYMVSRRGAAAAAAAAKSAARAPVASTGPPAALQTKALTMVPVPGHQPTAAETSAATRA